MANYTSPQSDSNISTIGLSGYKIENYLTEKGRLDSSASETYKREKLREVLKNSMKFE